MKVYNVVESYDVDFEQSIDVTTFSTKQKAVDYINATISESEEQYKNELSDVSTDNQTYFNVDTDNYYSSFKLVESTVL